MGNITAKLVKDLRDKTGAGMMDCKKALNETDGNLEKALEWLRKKGIASADKKAGRIAAEGSIGSYIHTGSRVGVLLELNCETDFVARGDIFQSLLKDVSMQVAACPNVEYVSIDEIPQDVVEKEKKIEMGRDDLTGKPEQIKEKIVEGRIAKRTEQMLNGGLLEETAELLSSGIEKNLSASNSVGYRECIAHLKGEIPKKELASAINYSTRRLVSKQRKWFRKHFGNEARLMICDQLNLSDTTKLNWIRHS